MLENDGRNERQLVEWAHVYQYLHRFTIVRLEAGRADPSSWFNDSEVTALTLWLWWMIFFPGQSLCIHLTGLILLQEPYKGNPLAREMH